MFVTRPNSAAVMLLALVAAACGSAQALNTPTTLGPEASSNSELESLYRARQDSARMRFSEADVRFMTGMIAHHAQALVMSDLASSHAAGGRILVLTSRIINAQRDEITTMQNWLGGRDQQVPVVHIDGLNLMIGGPGGHDGLMPGMLTREQLEELDGARGEDFDRLFLTYMIMHHQGAITMVDELFETDGAGQGEQAFKLASDIYADQSTEIARMQLMLTNMTPGDGGQ